MNPSSVGGAEYWMKSSPNMVIKKSEIKNPRILRIQMKFIRSPSQGLFEKSDIFLLGRTSQFK